MSRALVGAALALALSASAAGAGGPSHAVDTLERYFRLEWQATPGARGPEITGYVENVGNVPVDRMRLTIERLDAGGTVVGTSSTWVMGVVTPQHRNYFTTRVAAAATYRVRILTFDWSNCRD
jgi:hypothetical protein